MARGPVTLSGLKTKIGDIADNPEELHVSGEEFSAALKKQVDGAYAQFADRLARDAFTVYSTGVSARYVPTRRERLRWVWGSFRQRVAAACLWVLRVEARDLTDEDDW